MITRFPPFSRPPAADVHRHRRPGVRPVSAHAALSQWQLARAALRNGATGGAIARTATFNVVAAGTAALGGVILARAAGPTVRGDYAAVTAWFGVLLILCDMGQPAALCFYVARDPGHARAYVATSRAMVLATGAVTIVLGQLLAPVLSHGQPRLADAYRIVFTGSVIAFVASSYTFPLQARSLQRWNLVRVSQPVLGMAGIILLWQLGHLTLDAAAIVLVATFPIQLGLAYRACRTTGLAPGRARKDLVRPLAGYGLAQMAALTPATLNLYLDQLVLSQVVPAADLGRYAIAVSVTLLPVPLVMAVGNVAFPRLAAQQLVTARSGRLQRAAVLGSAALAIGLLLPAAICATWLIPLVLGAAYRGAVPLLWILTPGGIFLACSQVVGDLLRGRNRPTLVAASQGLAAIFTVVLLFALLPLAGVAAAAIATTVAYGVALAAMIRCLWRLPHQDPAADDPDRPLEVPEQRTARRRGPSQ
jgi:O-antigen/teichoic acid export membrane protein